MQTQTAPANPSESRLPLFFASRAFALFGFVLAHLLLVWLGLSGKSTPMGDITFAYEPWARQMQSEGSLLGLTQPWVYPFPNLLLVLAPRLLGPDYQMGWLLLSSTISVLAALFVLIGAKAPMRTRVLAVWIWVACLLAMGPVSISRLDSASVAVAIVGVVLWQRGGVSQKAASATFALAVWLKVWPIALLVGAFASTKRRLATFGWFLAPAAVITLLGLALGGSLASIFSFFTQQSGRGLQIESPWAAPWLWVGVSGSKDAGIYFDQPLLTFQVFGTATSVFANLLSFVMYGAVLITIALGYKASKTGLAPDRIFAWTAMTAVLDLIVFNKVGSPQYYGWLIAPLLFGVLAGVWRLRGMGSWVIALCALTGLIYPAIYDNILALDWWAIGVLTLRNLAAIALLIYSNLQLTALGKLKSSLSR